MTIFFDDELEDGNTLFQDYFDNYASPNGTTCGGQYNIAYDTTTKFSGAGSLRMNYDNTGDTDSCTAGSSFRNFSSPVIWYRFYYRLSSDWQTGTTGTKIIPITSNKNLSIWTNMLFSGLNIRLTIQNFEGIGNATNINSTVNLTKEVWHLIELGFGMGTNDTADGFVQYYLNGTKQTLTDNGGHNWDAVELRDTASGNNDAVWAHMQLYKQHGFGQTWYDRLAVGNTRIGSSEDTPSAPTGLVVV